MVELCSAHYFMNKPAPWELCSFKRLLGNSRHRSGDIQCKRLPGLRGRLALLGHRVMNRMKSRSIVKLLVSMALLGSMDPICLGQTPTFRIYLPNLAEEDWSFLKDRSKSVDFWDPVKYISLGAEDRFLTLSRGNPIQAGGVSDSWYWRHPDHTGRLPSSALSPWSRFSLEPAVSLLH